MIPPRRVQKIKGSMLVLRSMTFSHQWMVEVAMLTASTARVTISIVVWWSNSHSTLHWGLELTWDSFNKVVGGLLPPRTVLWHATTVVSVDTLAGTVLNLHNSVPFVGELGTVPRIAGSRRRTKPSDQRIGWASWQCHVLAVDRQVIITRIVRKGKQ